MPDTPQPEHQADRVIVGFCPEDRRVVIVLNNREAWPLCGCECGWTGPTTALLLRSRFERGGTVKLAVATVAAAERYIT